MRQYKYECLRVLRALTISAPAAATADFVPIITQPKVARPGAPHCQSDFSLGYQPYVPALGYQPYVPALGYQPYVPALGYQPY